MKYVVENSLSNFPFWGGAKYTAEQLTDEQFDLIEQAMEEEQPEGGWTDTEINDFFWFEPDTILKWVGVYPKYYRLTAKNGIVQYVAAANSSDVEKVESSQYHFGFEEVDKVEAGYNSVEDVSDFDFEDFAKTRYFQITSCIGDNEIVVRCDWDYNAEELKEAFAKCKIEELHSEDGSEFEYDYDWGSELKDDPETIDNFVYDEDEMFDCYNIPTYALCPIENDDWSSYELTEEDAQNIHQFLDNLDKQMPNGWTMDWEDLDNPFFDSHPAFGLPCDCYKVRVYPVKTKE